MSFISTDEVRQHISTALDDDALQTLIDAEEAALARRVGPLDTEYSEMVEVFEPDAGQPIVLTRPTDEVEVDDAGTGVEVTLRQDGRTLVNALSWSWLGPVTVTYTPTDDAEVRGVLIELLRLRATETGYTTEQTDSYSYQNDPSSRARRRQGLIASLLPKRRPASIRVTSSVRPRERIRRATV